MENWCARSWISLQLVKHGRHSASAVYGQNLAAAILTAREDPSEDPDLVSPSGPKVRRAVETDLPNESRFAKVPIENRHLVAPTAGELRVKPDGSSHERVR